MRVPFFAAAAGLVLAACGPTAPSAPPSQARGPAQPSAQPPESAGYLAPPDLSGARRTAAGLVLEGRAPGGADVALASPQGERFTARADAGGTWRVNLPPYANPDMFALSATLGGRVIRAPGAVLILPDPGPPATLVQAGFAAEPLGAAPRAPVIVSLDYDRGGAAAVGGLVRPMARVRLSIDGAAAGLGQADEQGRFSILAANRPLTPGRRVLEVDADTGRVTVETEVSQPQPLGLSVYRAVRQPGAWRVDWTPAGGGVQTSVVFDRSLGAGS